MTVPKHIAARQDLYSREIREISASLTELQPKNASMPEHVFVQVFLPMFAGDENPTYKPTMARWAELAGNFYASMDIVNSHGQVIFTVPPIANRDAIDPSIEQDPRERPLASFFTIASTYQQLLGYNPNQAELFLEAELTKRPLLMKNPANVMADFEKWNEIFTRYGRPTVKLPGKVQDATKAQPADNDDDESYNFQTL